MEKLFAISMSYTTDIHINVIYEISSTQELPTFQDDNYIHKIYKERSKLDT